MTKSGMNQSGREVCFRGQRRRISRGGDPASYKFLEPSYLHPNGFM